MGEKNDRIYHDHIIDGKTVRLYPHRRKNGLFELLIPGSNKSDDAKTADSLDQIIAFAKSGAKLRLRMSPADSGTPCNAYSLDSITIADTRSVDATTAPAAYLLTWNPELFPYEEMRVDTRWSSGNTTKIKKGDRLFLMKQGSPPRGIVASGTATVDVFEDEHWDAERRRRGDTANYVGLKWDTVLDLDRVPPLDPQSLPVALQNGIHWATASSGITIAPIFVPKLEEAWRDHLSKHMTQATVVPAKHELLSILERYRRDRTVFDSPVEPQRYLVTDVDSTSATLRLLNRGDDERITVGLFDRCVEQLNRNGGKLPIDEMGGSSAQKAAVVQAPRLGMSADRKHLLDLSSAAAAIKNLLSIVPQLTVDRSGGVPKVYKPVMLWSAIQAIADGALTENRIPFDFILPRFLDKAERLNVSVREQQAVQAFARLCSDQIWLLSFVDDADLFDAESATASRIRSGVSHALLKDTYWHALQDEAGRRQVLKAIEDTWWPSTDNRATAYWWVNQGRTFDQERKLGVIWAPQKNESGATFFHWQNVSKVRSGDIVFSYANGEVCAVSEATSDGREGQQPDELSGHSWHEAGWTADVAYHDLATPVKLNQINAQIRELGLNQGPINAAGGVNQAYLFSLPPSAARIVAAELDIDELPDSIAEKLRALLAETVNPGPPMREDQIPDYTVDDALDGIFMERSEFEAILQAWYRKKNLIVTGPPGVGKTFRAKRLAYALMRQMDASRIEMVQFHQSYAYEDFVQGWRPKEAGGFTRKDGVFHAFCQRAAADRDRPYVFIIDEINRGNLSRVFGELLVLIEADRRGEAYQIPLTYSHDAAERFFVPENVYLLGMMNTADRSLAMVDYALRRRFAFAQLTPAFGSSQFSAHLGRHVSDGLAQMIPQRMILLNQAIASDRNLGPGFVVGHSFFCTPSDNGRRHDRAWYESVVRQEVAPLLREYWFDDLEKAEQAVADLLA